MTVPKYSAMFYGGKCKVWDARLFGCLGVLVEIGEPATAGAVHH
jgi:hypothetical protein